MSFMNVGIAAATIKVPGWNTCWLLLNPIGGSR